MEQKNQNSASTAIPTPTGPPPVLAYPAAAAAAPFASYAHLYPPQPHLPLVHQPAQPNQQLQIFWADQYREIEQVADFKNHNLPLARIKKIMKVRFSTELCALFCFPNCNLKLAPWLCLIRN
jgi:nuclear transcription factor Y, gamma